MIEEESKSRAGKSGPSARARGASVCRGELEKRPKRERTVEGSRRGCNFMDAKLLVQNYHAHPGAGLSLYEIRVTFT